MTHSDAGDDASLNWLPVDTEIVVREMVELAVANWISSQTPSANGYEPSELEILAGRLLQDTRRLEKCWTTASKCAASRLRYRPSLPRTKRGL